MDIPAHLERVHQQHPDLTQTSATYQNSDTYIYDSLPRHIPLSKLPGQKFLDVLQNIDEFNLLRTNAEATLGPDEDSEWRPHYYIGGGSFGKVGVWQNKNAKDEVVDEVAIKEMQGCYRELFWPESRSLGLRRRLLAEAAMQSQLNQSQSENFVHLRDYKYFNQDNRADNDKLYEDPDSLVNPSEGTEKWRFYLELAPYGDLYDLIGKYRYWNQYLPEAFIWHVFDSLAEAAVNLRDCQWADMPTHRFPRGPPETTDKMVHYDIKPDNIFLSYPDHRSNHPQQNRSTYGGTKKYDYPVIKLGDYGLNRWTGRADGTNPGNPIGTSGFMPPEMVQYGIWWEPIRDANYTVPFSSSLRPKDRSSFCLTDKNDGEYLGYPRIGDVMRGIKNKAHFVEDEKLHVWAIGKVIYDMMHLCNSEVYWERSTAMRDEFIRHGNHQMSWFDPGPQNANTDDSTRIYSVELGDLVRDCLRPFWRERLDVDHMKVRAAAGMADWDRRFVPGREDVELDKMDPQRDTKHPKLVYRDNDINNMPRGKELFVMVANDDAADELMTNLGVEDYRRLKDQIRHDPDWPDLKPVWDDHTKRRVRLPGAELGANPVSETHHQNWVQERAKVTTEVQDTYELDPRNGGLRIRALWTGDPNDDNNDDGNDENPYTAPRLVPRGHPPSDTLTPPSVSPLSPIQQSTAPQPATQPPTTQLPTTQPPTTQPPPTQPPTVQRPTTPPSPTWRSPTPIAPLSPDPTDCITDPSDSEVEIVIRKLRGRRKISYYRPKWKNLKDFNQEYVRRRRGEKVNAKVEPWLTSGNSKFQNAIRRRKEAWSQSKREYDTRKISYDRWKARQQTIVTQANPITTTSTTVPALPNANQTQRPPLITTYQGFPLPPRQPGQENWADGYFRAWTAAQARRIPNLPPNGNGTDLTFRWDDASRRFLRTENNTLMYYQPNNAPQQQGTGRWIPLLQFPQVTHPNGNPNTNLQPNPPRPARPQPAPPQAPPQTGPSQPVPGSLTALPTDSLPARLPNQRTWANGYFQAWASGQAGVILPIPRNVDPTDVTFYWNDVQRAYLRQDRSGRTLVWRPGLVPGQGQWVELRMDRNGMPQLYVPNNVGPNTNPTNPRPNYGPPSPPQPVPSQAGPSQAGPTTTRPLRGLVRTEHLPPRLAVQSNWAAGYYQIWVSRQMGYLPPIPPGVSPTDNTFYFHLTYGWYMRQDSQNRTWAWSEEQPTWTEVHFTKNGKLRIRGGWGG